MEKESVKSLTIIKKTNKLIKIFIDIKGQTTYKLRFEKIKENKLYSMVGINCVEDRYHKDYLFNHKEPYILSVSQNFDGNIIIDKINGKEFKIRIRPGMDEYTFSYIDEGASSLKSTGSRYSHTPKGRKPASKKEDKEIKAMLEIGNQYLTSHKEGVHTVTKENSKEFFTLQRIEAFRQILLGLPGDVSQLIWDKSNIKYIFSEKIIGLSFKIEIVKQRRFLVLIGWNKLLPFFAKINPSAYPKPTISSGPNIQKLSFWLKGTFVTALIGSAIGIWGDDDEEEMSEIIAILISSFVKAGLAVLADIIAVTIAVFLFPALAGGSVLIGTGIVFAFGVSAALNYIDSMDGYTNKLDKYFEEKLKQIDNVLTIASTKSFWEEVVDGLSAGAYFGGRMSY